MSLFDKNIQEEKSYTDQFIGEGKKYSSVEELAKAYANADTHIDSLQQENKAFKEKGISDAIFTDVINNNQSAENVNHKVADTQNGGAITEEMIQKLVDERLNQKSLQSNEMSNENKSEQFLLNSFGNKEKAIEQLGLKAQELGTTVSELQAISKKSPAMFMQLFNNGSKQNVNQSLQQSTNTEGLLMNTNKKGFKHYMDLKKSNEKAFRSQAIQIEIQEAKLALGKSYYEY